MQNDLVLFELSALSTHANRCGRPARLALMAALLASAAHAASVVHTGQLYTQTNASTGNQIALFDRGADGAVSFDQFIPTGGLGTDAALGNQGALVLTSDERFLLSVNAGSNDLSVFRVEERGLTLLDVEPARGERPVSISVHDDIVYVVNAGTDSISGFRLDFDGQLTFNPGSLARLSTQNTAPAQIQFDPRGDYLYVTEKATSRIVRYRLNADADVVERTFIQSPNSTPFGFALGMRAQLFVSEAASGAPGASSVTAYQQSAGGILQIVAASVPTTQTAGCWIVATPDGRTIFCSNTGSDSISAFSVGFDGQLQLLDATAANTAAGPLDMAISTDSRFLYVLDGAAGLIGDYVIGANGSLTGIPGTEVVLPVGSSGLAVR